MLLAFPTPIGEAFNTGRAWIVTNLGWFFIMGVTTWLVFLLWVAFSRFGLSLHTWAIFTLPGLAFGFFIYRYNLPMPVSSRPRPRPGARPRGARGRRGAPHRPSLRDWWGDTRRGT